jgi:glutaredoxin
MEKQEIPHPLEIPHPTKSGYTIYTKQNCKYCSQAKELLKKEEPQPLIIECDAFLKEDREGFLKTMEERLKYEYKTFPMVFHDGIFLGGYTETQLFYDKQHLSFEEWEEIKHAKETYIDPSYLPKINLKHSEYHYTFTPSTTSTTDICSCLMTPCSCVTPNVCSLL